MLESKLEDEGLPENLKEHINYVDTWVPVMFGLLGTSVGVGLPFLFYQFKEPSPIDSPYFFASVPTGLFFGAIAGFNSGFRIARGIIEGLAIDNPRYAESIREYAIKRV